MVLALAGDSTITSLPDLRRGVGSAADFDDTRTGFAPFLAVVFFADRFAATFFLLTRLPFGSGAGGVRPSCAAVAPMRYSVVPHTGHDPCMAGAALLVNTACAFANGRGALHFIQ